MATASKSPSAQSQLLIRRPAAKIYAAFVEPRMLAKFWLKKASGPLALGKTVTWHFPVDGISDKVTATLLEPGRRIVVRWSDGTETEWTFEAVTRTQTMVSVSQTVKGSARQRVEAAINGTEGYTLVLADLKVLLERKIRSGIVKDKGVLIMRAMRSKKKTR
ncbi:MAG: SRPBCC domain-containing protein [Verrucomicrobiota bacterium]